MKLIAFVLLSVGAIFALGQPNLIELGAVAVGSQYAWLTPPAVLLIYGLLVFAVAKGGGSSAQIIKAVDNSIRAEMQIFRTRLDDAIKDIRVEIRDAGAGLTLAGADEIADVLRKSTAVSALDIDGAIAKYKKLSDLISAIGEASYWDDGDEIDLNRVIRAAESLSELTETLDKMPKLGNAAELLKEVGAVGAIIEKIGDIERDIVPDGDWDNVKTSLAWIDGVVGEIKSLAMLDNTESLKASLDAIDGVLTKVTDLANDHDADDAENNVATVRQLIAEVKHLQRAV